MADQPHLNGHIPQDYHAHTDTSCDSKATMAQMCQAALDRGIHEIAFTDHFDVHPKDHCGLYYRPDRYFEVLEAAREQFGPLGLAIRAGVEVGEPHRFGDTHAPVLEKYPYDIVLGSLHWLGDMSMFNRNYFRSYKLEEVLTAYFGELQQMIRAGGFDVVAHVDVFKRVGTQVYGALDSAQWEDWLRPVWRECIDAGIGIEINTASLRRGVDEMHPGPAALRWYREMGGEILTLGSDGHQPDHVGAGLDAAVEMARAAGFTQVAVFEQRQVVRWLPI